MPRAVSILAVAVLSVFPAGASAGTRVSRDAPWAGPDLAGGRVVWAFGPRNRSETGLSGEMQVKVALPGRRPRLLWRARGRPYRHSITGIAGSSRRVAFLRSLRSRDELWVGTPRRRPRRIAVANRGSSDCPPGFEYVDVSGRLVAYGAHDNCSSRRIVIRDFATGGRPRTVAPVAQELRGISLARRFLAWREYGFAPPFQADPVIDEIVVYDRQTGQTAYRVNVRKLIPADQRDSYSVSFALQSDGKLAVLTSTGPFSRAGLAWFTPGEPFAHGVPGGASPGDVALARDLLAVRYGSDIVLLDLRGRRVRRLGRLADPLIGVRAIAWDGRRAAWGGDGIHTASLRR